MDTKNYTNLCDKLNWLVNGKPRTNALIYCIKIGDPPEICLDFQTHFSFFQSTGKPVNFLINLIVSYIEELIHSADPSKTEIDIQQVTCDAIDSFAEVKLTAEIKENRLNKVKKYDNTKNQVRDNF